jgi:acyl-CoA synthetase (AMP-forming)/AMP-acid ligase II
MLYDQWQEMARSRKGELAIRDLVANEDWTFERLRREGERGQPEGGECAFPQGHSTGFVVEVLRAWRAGCVVCPLEPEQPQPRFEAPLPPRCRHLKVTSATSGRSRFVAFAPESLAADARNIVSTMGLRPEWPNLGVISMAHSYGFSNLVLPLLLHGIPLVLVPSPLPEVVKRAAEGLPAATLPGVPALWRAWREAGALPASIRLAISAGAPLPLELERAVFLDCGIKIHNFYGSSECGGIAYDGAETPRTEAGFAGRAMGNVALSVGSNGCMEVRGAAVGMTYWPEPEPELGDGVFRTSDLATLTSQGVVLSGRLGDQINVAGRKVSPEAIERALRAHPSVRDCLVFGVPAEQGERVDVIAACVAAAGKPDVEALRQFLLARLPAWQIPREWRFMDSLEANRRGKISRAEWRRRFLEERGERG